LSAEVVNGVVSHEPVTTLQMGKVYSGGNLRQLKNFFGSEATVVYAGDDLTSDVLIQHQLSTALSFSLSLFLSISRFSVLKDV
jgi:hypothetical protein